MICVPLLIETIDVPSGIPNAITFMFGFNARVKSVLPSTLSSNVNTLPLVGPAIVLNSIFSIFSSALIAPSSASTGNGAEGIPPRVPIIIGCCCSTSANATITDVPSTGPIGVCPIPFIAAEVTG